MSNVEQRIPEETLAEQWYSFVHELIGNMQAAFRSANVTQKAIAVRLGKKESFISRCLSGQQNMTIRTIYYIARAMGYRLEIRFRKLSSLVPANNRLADFQGAPAITPSATAIPIAREAAVTAGNRQFAHDN